MANFKKFSHEVSNVRLTLSELHQHYHLWDCHTLRTLYEGSAHRESSDIWLRYNDINAENLEDELYNGTTCIDYPAMRILTECRKIVTNLLMYVKGEKVGRVIITKLPPGGVVEPHKDEGLTCKYYDRFHVVLQEGGVFCVDYECVRMGVGEIWWFNNQKLHSVLNDSNHPRIHLIIDIKLAETSRYWFLKHCQEKAV